MKSRTLTHSRRDALRDIRRQLRTTSGWYIGVLVMLAVLTGIVLYLHHNTHILVTELFEDPVEYGVLPLHVGVYSYLSGTSMIIAGSILLFGAWAVTTIHRELRLFAAVLGSFLLWLGFDDVFMIHEWVGLRLAWFIQSENVPSDRQWLESYVFIAYGLAWIGILLLFRRVILRTSWLLLLLTLAGFGTSVLFDLYQYIGIFPKPKTSGQSVVYFVIEDLGKLAGAFFALAYAVCVSGDFVRGRVADRSGMTNSA